MNVRRALRHLCLLLAGLTGLAPRASVAQLDPGLPAPLWRELRQMANRDLTAQGRLEATVREAGRPPFSFAAPLALRPGKLRLDLDLKTLATAGEVPELELLAEAGVRQVTVLLAANPQAAWLVVPQFKAACPLRTTGTGGAVLTDREQGRAELEGHPCVIRRVTLREGRSESVLLLWEALDLKRLPLRGEWRSPAEQVVFRLTRVTAGAPAPAFFTVPPGFRVCATPAEMLLGGLLGE